MAHIFISYSHQDSDYAHRLADALINRELSVWMDDEIDYGEQWPNVIGLPGRITSEPVVGCRRIQRSDITRFGGQVRRNMQSDYRLVNVTGDYI